MNWREALFYTMCTPSNGINVLSEATRSSTTFITNIHHFIFNFPVTIFWNLSLTFETSTTSSQLCFVRLHKVELLHQHLHGSAPVGLPYVLHSTCTRTSTIHIHILKYIRQYTHMYVYYSSASDILTESRTAKFILMLNVVVQKCSSSWTSIDEPWCFFLLMIWSF